MNAGERGDLLAEIVQEELACLTDIEREIVINRVLRVLHERPKAAEAPKPKPMSDAQARAFGATLMPFGKHEGWPIMELPLAYLCFLVDPSEFRTNLGRYLDNPEIRRQIEES